MMLDYNGNKGFRLLNIYERLNKGEILHKEQLAIEFGVSLKTIQRDIDSLRMYLMENHYDEQETIIKYNRIKDGYYLVRFEREWLTNEEVLAMCKILLESRAFCKEELQSLITKLLKQVVPTSQPLVKEIINNEYAQYIPLKHNKKLLSLIWELSHFIVEQKMISFSYTRQDGKYSEKIVKPVSIMFSEYYFYLVAFADEGTNDYPIIFRIDRIMNLRKTGKGFRVPYRDRFNDGEFRKRILFMYSGELKTVTFEYTGVLEAALDRIPTARVIKEGNGVYTIRAEGYGKGIDMWIKSQGELARIIK